MHRYAPLTPEQTLLLARGFRAAVFGMLTLFVLWGAAARLHHLGRTPLGGDEGFTYLAAEGMLHHGLPVLPSGNVYYKSVFYSATAAGAAALGGLNERSLRLPGALFGTALVVLVFAGMRRVAGAGGALVAAGLVAASVWEIEFTRQARYYGQLQFFVTGAVLAFYSGFVLGCPRARAAAFVCSVLSALTHQLGYALILLYLYPLLLRGREALSDRGFLGYGLATAGLAAGGILFELFFWKVGAVNPTGHGASGAAAAVCAPAYSLYYLKVYDWLFPSMFAVVAAGVALTAVRLGLRLHRGGGENHLPFRTFLIVVLFSTLLVMGFGRSHLQPRYVFFTAPLFFMLYALSVRDLAFAATAGLSRLAGWAHGTVPRLVAAGLIGLLLLGATAEGCDPAQVRAVVARQPGDPIDHLKFLPSTSRRFDWDSRGPGLYVRSRLQPGDVVAGTHMIFQHVYAGRCDYWLWSASISTWNAYTRTDKGWTDTYLGVPLLRTLGDLRALIDSRGPRRVWIVTTPSLLDRNHVARDIRDFLLGENASRCVYTGRDGVSRVFLWDRQPA